MTNTETICTGGDCVEQAVCVGHASVAIRFWPAARLVKREQLSRELECRASGSSDYLMVGRSRIA